MPWEASQDELLFSGKGPKSTVSGLSTNTTIDNHRSQQTFSFLHPTEGYFYVSLTHHLFPELTSYCISIVNEFYIWYANVLQKPLFGSIMSEILSL